MVDTQAQDESLKIAFMFSGLSISSIVLIIMCILFKSHLVDFTVYSRPILLILLFLMVWFCLFVLYKLNTIISLGWILTSIGLIVDYALIEGYNFYLGLIGWSIIFALSACAFVIISQWKMQKNDKARSCQKVLIVTLCINIIYNIVFYPIMIYMSVSKYTLSDTFSTFNLLSTLLHTCLLLPLLPMFILFAKNLYQNDDSASEISKDDDSK